MATTTTTAPSPPHPTPAPTNPHLPPPFASSTTPLNLIAQGAEALLFQTTFLAPSQPAALKIRLPKQWRHPTLDKRLTRQRVLAEARVLVKCAREGVPVPAVLGVGVEEGWVAMGWVEGGSVKEAVRGRVIGNGEGEGREGNGVIGGEEELRGLMRRIGKAVGKLHSVGVVHGDLTTSNMMLRPTNNPAVSETNCINTTTNTEESSTQHPPSQPQPPQPHPHSLAGEIVLIDFGLAQQTTQEEDRAVDLYVLERAFGSTHPREEGMFGEVLEGYREAFPKGAKGTLRRLEDVRMRGRKKSMIG